MKVLSLFDGISCGRIALERAGIPVEAYHASEIEKNAIKVSQRAYPDIVQIGDVTKVSGYDYQECNYATATQTNSGIGRENQLMENFKDFLTYMELMGVAYEQESEEQINQLKALGEKQTLSFAEAEVLASFIMDTLGDLASLLIKREQSHFDIIVSALEKSGNFSTALINEVIDKDKILNNPQTGDYDDND